MADLEHLPHKISWTKKKRLHLTLFFLGYQSPALLESLIEEINKHYRSSFPSTINFTCSQVQLFPSFKPTVIALTGEAPPELILLRNQIANHLQKIDMHPDMSHEIRGFLPHITLGKQKEPTDLKNQPLDMSIQFNELILFKTEQTGPHCVTHTPLYTWGF